MPIKRISGLSGISPYLYPWTAQTYGPASISSNWIQTAIPSRWPGFRRITSLPRDSCGAIRCMPGMPIRKKALPGGSPESGTSWMSLISFESIISAGSRPTGQWNTGRRPPSTGNGCRLLAMNSLTPSRMPWETIFLLSPKIWASSPMRSMRCENISISRE